MSNHIRHENASPRRHLNQKRADQPTYRIHIYRRMHRTLHCRLLEAGVLGKASGHDRQSSCYDLFLLSRVPRSSAGPESRRTDKFQPHALHCRDLCGRRHPRSFDAGLLPILSSSHAEHSLFLGCDNQRCAPLLVPAPGPQSAVGPHLAGTARIIRPPGVFVAPDVTDSGSLFIDGTSAASLVPPRHPRLLIFVADGRDSALSH